MGRRILVLVFAVVVVASMGVTSWLGLFRDSEPPRTGERKAASGPLHVDPDNPRYFADATGRAVYLTGSHTWANFQERGIEGQTADLDYGRYLDFLVRHGHNFMRLWVWEHAQWMQFASPDTPVRYEPLAYRRTGPGEALDGKPKFDLRRFNPEYFKRLRKRVIAAGERGIYVSVMLFQGFSLDKTKGNPDEGNAWLGHPYNKANNINGVDGNPSGDGTGHETHTLAVPSVTRLQEAYVRKVVETVGDLENVLWEISNESRPESVPWQYHMIRYIHALEADKPLQHPVGMTASPIETQTLMRGPAEWISPDTDDGYLNDPPPNDGAKVIVVDNDHGNPARQSPQWPWKNLMRGNYFILMDDYNDYRGDLMISPEPALEATRQAMGAAHRLAARVDLAAMLPHGELASSGYCLAEPGRAYIVYRPEPAARALEVDVQAGRYAVQWMDPITGALERGDAIRATTDGRVALSSPVAGSAALYLKRLEPDDTRGLSD